MQHIRDENILHGKRWGELLLLWKKNILWSAFIMHVCACNLDYEFQHSIMLHLIFFIFKVMLSSKNQTNSSKPQNKKTKNLFEVPSSRHLIKSGKADNVV